VCPSVFFSPPNCWYPVTPNRFPRGRLSLLKRRSCTYAFLFSCSLYCSSWSLSHPTRVVLYHRAMSYVFLQVSAVPLSLSSGGSASCGAYGLFFCFTVNKKLGGRPAGIYIIGFLPFSGPQVLSPFRRLFNFVPFETREPSPQ